MSIRAPWRSPVRAARDFSGSTGGTGDGTGVTVTKLYLMTVPSLSSGGVGFGRRPLYIMKGPTNGPDLLSVHDSPPQGGGEWLHPLRSISSPLHPISCELSRR